MPRAAIVLAAYVTCVSMLLAATARTGSAQGAPPADTTVVASLRGLVYDSVARAPVAGALVRVFRSDNAAVGVYARTDAAGAFTVPTLRAGTWVASFLHPRLDSLRLEAPHARVDVVEAGEIELTLALPSAATLARALCGPPSNDGIAVLVGDVRDASARRPLPGATVRISWPEWVFARKKRMGREDVSQVARTDSSGRFVLCGVPQATTVTALAYGGRDTTGQVEITVPSTEYVVFDFLIDQDSAVSAAVTETVSSPTVSPTAAGRRGRGAVRGTVQTPDGRPFASAIARILGSGSATRSDSSGVFRISDAAAGTQTLEVRALGFEPQRRTVVLTPNDPLAVTFVVQKTTVRLDTVRVVAGRTLPPELERLERRWRARQGVILDHATVRGSAFGITSALLGIPGARLGFRAGYGNVVYMRNMKGQECSPPFFLDGFRFQAGDMTLDEVIVADDVAAIEVYVRGNVPVEFYSECGAVVVWTRSFFDYIPVLSPEKDRTRGR
ncbi:carboxypeptidase regulatory-like domain-containing protein [Gemmatimonas sp.]|uniref:carboxypeptidase regulatory-like domain-containing protein n=1 Tax=Gemmatimonas sp. TaxID=1962908 RepID=UPI003566EFE9